MKKFLLLMLLLLIPPWVSAQSTQTCEPYSASAIAVQTELQFATTQVTQTATELTLTTTLDPSVGWPGSPWQLSAVYSYVGTELPPMSAGVLLPGFYPYQNSNAPATGVKTVTQTIPLSTLGSVACGTPIYISVYVVAQFWNYDSSTNSYVLQDSLNGFIQGPNAIADANGGSNFGVPGYYWAHGLCCPNTVTGCVNTAGYYKTHSALAKPAQRDPWPISENTLVCGVTWYSVLNTKSSDNWYKLASQWIGAMLNVGDGASTPPEVDDALDQGQTLLNNTCRVMPKAQKSYSTSLITVLEAYNKGELQPPACTVVVP